eukprot:TRINITY_DN2228_c0_g2_i1.p2 TRINITY_DN2228_c0_g2~~TRINITY_DN2228_c0_g2_i1.p2  ORF type:complete len:105 (-),score=8.26 TRINITY_DN2228_c0_g2_i1:729-1043(-)
MMPCNSYVTVTRTQSAAAHTWSLSSLISSNVCLSNPPGAPPPPCRALLAAAAFFPFTTRSCRVRSAFDGSFFNPSVTASSALSTSPSSSCAADNLQEIWCDQHQ